MKNIFSGLKKTRQRMADAAGWQDRLIIADVGVQTAAALITQAEAAGGDMRKALVKVAGQRLQRLEAMMATAAQKPFVIITLGVNGSGKTTTIAKLAYRFLRTEKTVLLAAGDTFRAAAREQLEKWAQTLGGLDIVSGAGDPAAVAYNAISAALARQTDIVIIDTAGRLPTQKHLMAELGKIRRAANKALHGAPHELLLILDATTGQNALTQINAFIEAVGVTGVVVTKLDGSSKGGFLLSMAGDTPLPVRFVGVGEGSDDLALFDANEYAAALLGEASEQ